MNRYTELYAWIRKSFGENSFDIEEFRSTFPTSQAPKVIHDLLGQGYLKRIKRGTYKAVGPESLVENIVERGSETKEVVKGSQKKYAFCDSTAVAIWTSGYYWTGFTKGFRPLHIKVLKRDIDYWRKFFKKHRTNYSLPEENKTLYGFAYILHPEQDFEVVEKDGRKIVPLKEVVDFCLQNKITYQPALEYLDQQYDIHYRKRVLVDG